MPTYEYRCPEGHEFEEFQRMSDPPVATCPTCGAAAERQMSAGAGLLFKGSGFYITDYRSDSYKKAAEKESGGGGGKDAADTPAAKKKGGEGGSSTGSPGGSSSDKGTGSGGASSGGKSSGGKSSGGTGGSEKS